MVAKKEKILQMEVTKLEKMLVQRNETICGLQESHEYLLTTNGQLLERTRLRREKLAPLRMLLDAEYGKDESSLCDSIGINELDATTEKCGVLKDILLGLVDKRAGLERQCMGLDEQVTRETAAVALKVEHLQEVRNTLMLLDEDIHSTQWNFENDKAELAQKDMQLNTASQNAQRQAITAEKVHTDLRADKNAIEDLRTTWKNYEGMAHEEHRQIAIANEDARRRLVLPMRTLSRPRRIWNHGCKNSAYANVECLNVSVELNVCPILQEDMANVTFFKREISLRKKQERNMLAITQSSIKAKDEQLRWLERQLEHLKNEHNEAAKARIADESAFQAFREEHKKTLSSLEAQIKDSEKELKTTERAVTARNRKVSTLNNKVVQKTKVLAEWEARIDTRRDQAKKSAATQELVDAEVLSTQNLLDQELRRLERTQQLRAAQEVESEELSSTCAVLESEIQHARNTLPTIKDSITATQTAIKNRTDEIRDKFLNTFVVGDAEVLIELLNKEIESWTTKDSDEIDETVARKTTKVLLDLQLKERYNALLTDTHKKYGKILKQKEKQFNAKQESLKKRAEEKEKLATASISEPKVGEEFISEMPERQGQCVSAKGDAHETRDNLAPEEQKSELERLSKEAASQKTLDVKNQRKSKGVSAHQPTSARRQIGLNLVDDSPQTDKELTDIVATTDASAVAITRSAKSNGGNAVRRPRLKRRTPAQKAGRSELTNASPTAMLHEGIADSIHTNLAFEVSIQDSLGSPVCCDEDPAASGAAHDTGSVNAAKKASGSIMPSLGSQTTAKGPLLQRVDQRNKDVVKRRTSKKALHRSRHPKPNRISLGRSQTCGSTADWTAVDAFSFD
ncbi:hypothetical protein P3T76_011896 [Phytophthora citrophthora]|uniref:Uncharacterized protein n=1 Tax=Phytophthora citrophthora TaxID=4793 RepID=A0AAD9LFJ5_9STRA|nr:hypothetical protein P3T76_011896 [Phytophthora citrophthora]